MRNTKRKAVATDCLKRLFMFDILVKMKRHKHSPRLFCGIAIGEINKTHTIIEFINIWRIQRIYSNKLTTGNGVINKRILNIINQECTNTLALHLRIYTQMRNVYGRKGCLPLQYGIVACIELRH